MRKKRSSLIQKQYKYESESNAYLIEVGLEDYNDIYDQWDPAPFRKRFIQEEFNEFIITSAEDIPKNYNIILVLYLPEASKDDKKEGAVRAAYANFYLYAAAKEKRSLADIQKKTLLYLLFSIALLGIGYVFLNKTEHIVLNIIREGIFIGGWVFLWEAITNIFITRRDIINMLNLYKRVYLSEIRFIYRQSN